MAQVYVGNLVAGLVTEDALRQLFNSTMAAAFPQLAGQGMDAVVSVSMHSEGRYAFVELRTPEMASAALQLSNQARATSAALAPDATLGSTCSWQNNHGSCELDRGSISQRALRWIYSCVSESVWAIWCARMTCCKAEWAKLSALHSTRYSCTVSLPPGVVPVSVTSLLLRRICGMWV